jgi:exodeoxyribonuclease-3
VVKGSASRSSTPKGRFPRSQLRQAVGDLAVPAVGLGRPHRQASKFRFLDRFFHHLKKLKDCGARSMLCGDWNIAHKEIDLKNWRGNRKNSGFLPEGARLAEQGVRGNRLRRTYSGA